MFLLQLLQLLHAWGQPSFTLHAAEKKMIIQVHAGRPKAVPTSVLRKILQDALKMRVENFADKQSFKLEGVLLSGFPFNACYLSFQYLFLSTNVPEYCQLGTYLP